MKELAKALNLTVDALRGRLKRRSLEQIIWEIEHPEPPPPPPTPEIILHEKFPYKGRELTIPELAAIAGITPSAMRSRLKGKTPWTPEEAVGDKPRTRPDAVILTVETPDGPVSKPLSQWSKERGIPKPTISLRKARGWTDAQALDFEPGPRQIKGAMSPRRKRKTDD